MTVCQAAAANGGYAYGGEAVLRRPVTARQSQRRGHGARKERPDTPVESAPTEELLRHPAHPYTEALLSAVPVLGGDSGRLNTIGGVVPRPEDYPPGCRFYGRCLRAKEGAAELCGRCAEEPPVEHSVSAGHIARCHALEYK